MERKAGCRFIDNRDPYYWHRAFPDQSTDYTGNRNDYAAIRKSHHPLNEDYVTELFDIDETGNSGCCYYFPADHPETWQGKE
jgi:hypothetical protein